METFSALLAFCAGNSPFTGESPHKGQWRGALMFSLNNWVHNREAGDLRRHRARYDVSVMNANRYLMGSYILCYSTLPFVNKKLRWMYCTFIGSLNHSHSGIHNMEGTWFEQPEWSYPRNQNLLRQRITSWWRSGKHQGMIRTLNDI